MQITIVEALAPEHRARAAQGYWAAFAVKLRVPLGPEAKGRALLERVIDPNFAISALSPDGALLGVAGFKTAQGAFVGGGLRDLARVYGWPGALWRGVLLDMLERDIAPDTLLMDGIFVMEEARGKGVGTALLGAIVDRARTMGVRQVRLDVIDSNPRARALYEREGFVAQGQEDYAWLKPVFGFRAATRMVRPVPPADQP